MLTRIRSLIFDLCFYGFAACYLTFFRPLVYLGSRGITQKIFRGWGQGSLFLMKHVLGLTWRLEGREHLDKALAQGAFIFACQHQSLWETIIFSTVLPNFATVSKADLARIPVFGGYMRKLDAILLRREDGAAALRQLGTQGRAIAARGLPIIMFPQGSRIAPGNEIVLKPGLGYLYEQCGVPILPVVLNSGVFWGRRKLFKKPGCITVRVLEMIPAGLPRREAMALAVQAMSSAQADLH